MTSKRRKLILNLIGLIAAVALAAILWLAFQTPHVENPQNTASQLPSATLEFDSEELVFTGSGMLDLMEGVHATDGDGTDLTHQVNAVITSSGTLTRKTVRYSVYGANGEVVTRERSLLLQNYTGPSLEVTQPLQFDSAQLPRLIDYLQEEDLLRAKHLREHLERAVFLQLKQHRHGPHPQPPAQTGRRPAERQDNPHRLGKGLPH